jgi:hypothetical protein
VPRADDDDGDDGDDGDDKEDGGGDSEADCAEHASAERDLECASAILRALRRLAHFTVATGPDDGIATWIAAVGACDAEEEEGRLACG